MCGIAGSVGSVQREIVAAAALCLAHRGPDDAGLWSSQDQRCHLAHRRLSIIDLSAAGHQPMWDESRSCLVVFNGEIYNYRKLRQELISEGCQLRGQSDTEVLVNLYRRRGPAFVRDLNGIFAFAIHDLANGKTLLARDRHGVKPLYFSRLPGGVVFASEIKALLSVPGLPLNLNPRAIAGYLGLLYAVGADTSITAIKKWRPGLLAEITACGDIVELVDFARNSPPVVLGKDATPDGLLGVLDQAVSRQLVSDAKVGAFLSGGVDSSAILASAAAAGTVLHCYTLRQARQLGGRDQGADDLPYARAVARHYGAELTELEVSVSDLKSVDSLVRMLEEPHAVPSALCTFLLSQRARQDGIKVMLSGTGGDELFGGYRRHLAARAMPLWMWLPHAARRQLANWANALPAKRPALRKLGKLFAHVDQDEDGQIAALNLWIPDLNLRDILTGDFWQRLGGEGNQVALEQQLRRMPPELSPLSKSLLLDQVNFLPEQCLNYSDKMAMAAGVEVRVPFLDDELVAFANAMPDWQKCGWRGTKLLLKEALALRLPRQLVYRPKQGFGIPLREWMHAELGEQLDEYISSRRIHEQGVFDAKGLRRLVELDKAGKADATYTLYAVLCIDSWIRQFLEKP